MSGTASGSARSGSPTHTHTKRCRSTTGYDGTIALGLMVFWAGISVQRPAEL